MDYIKLTSLLNKPLLLWAWAGMLLAANILPFGKAVNDVSKHGSVIRLDHLFHFGGCLLLPLFAVSKQYNKVWMALLLLAYCASLELVQILLPYRAFNPDDLLSNLFGCVIGFILLSWIKALHG